MIIIADVLLVLSIVLLTMICGEFLLKRAIYFTVRNKYSSKELKKLLDKLIDGDITVPSKSYIFFLHGTDLQFGDTVNTILFKRNRKSNYDDPFNHHVASNLLSWSGVTSKEGRWHYKAVWFFYFEDLSKMPLYLNTEEHIRKIAEWRLDIGK